MEPSFLKSICPLLFERSDNAWVMQARTQEDPVLAGDRVRVRILTPCHVYVFCPNRGAFVKAFFVQRSSDDRAWLGRPLLYTRNFPGQGPSCPPSRPRGAAEM